MRRVSLEEAFALAEQHFPAGPEALCETLGMSVRYAACVGTEGWCVHNCASGNTRITINSRSPRVRQRFTLAHEVAHVLRILNAPNPATSPTHVPWPSAGPFVNDLAEERVVDAIAADLLIPRGILRVRLPHLPATEREIAAVAKAAGISPWVVCQAMTAHASALGLSGAEVVFIRQDRVDFRRSSTGEPLVADAKGEHQRALVTSDAALSNTASIAYKHETVSLLFVQRTVAPRSAPSADDLRKQLFGEDRSLQGSFAGAIGAWTNRHRSSASFANVDALITGFIAHYTQHWSKKPHLLAVLRSDACRQWLLLVLRAKLSPPRATDKG